ncbi:hypothetical protein [Hymenobacter sp. CRA2]|uniref:hypothetical protein n=1 Tax=Hymenobacter sp. CRA2 TaxID=1955620 RepID=UPI00111657D4|nr:hypothetical protein [Hymenobacter sp. CRA2]
MNELALSPARRRRLVIGAVRFMTSSGYPPSALERSLLAQFALGRMSIKQVEEHLAANKPGGPLSRYRSLAKR